MITLYPAIDLQGGLAVRLEQGDFEASTTFNEDPVAQAQQFADDGATALHVVGLDGAREGAPVHAPLVAEIVRIGFPVTCSWAEALGFSRGRDRDRSSHRAPSATVVLGTVALQDRDLS